MKMINHTSKIYILLGLLLTMGCNDTFFDRQPLDSISDETFWKTEEDAQLALVGCYRGGGFDGGRWTSRDFWVPWALLNMEVMAGNASEKELGPDRVTDGSLTSTNDFVGGHWQQSYKRITTCNNFLDHIGDINMDTEKKEMMVAEVRTIRAFEYFNLALYFGDVPLVTTILTIPEANSVTRNPKSEVWAFAETELKESVPHLPETRPVSEDGRITSGAALAILGRLQMADQNWAEAANTYKTIIDAGTYSLFPQFREMFWQSNEINSEYILTSQYKEDDYSHVHLQFLYPEMAGGWHQFSPYNELVKEFLAIDGRPIEESEMYDPNDPYENRDPRLDYTILISDRSTFKGNTFVSRPDSNSPDRFTRYNWSGYSISKFMDEEFSGNLMNYGGNFPLIRYAEVLLGYLESMVESGAPINLAILDESINLVRNRESVNMPSVTTTDPQELREIIRRERRVELAFEGVRYYDILRWGIAAEELNRDFTGMKLTNDPDNYTAYSVDDEGYLIYQSRRFKEGVNELWPIPQSEIDINDNMTQNSGYSGN